MLGQNQEIVFDNLEIEIGEFQSNSYLENENNTQNQSMLIKSQFQNSQLNSNLQSASKNGDEKNIN